MDFAVYAQDFRIRSNRELSQLKLIKKVLQNIPKSCFPSRVDRPEKIILTFQNFCCNRILSAELLQNFRSSGLVKLNF